MVFRFKKLLIRKFCLSKIYCKKKLLKIYKRGIVDVLPCRR